MKYTFEPFKEDGSPRKQAGMFRQPFSALNINGYIACRCGSILQTFQQTESHWSMGHFDAVLYEDEENEV